MTGMLWLSQEDVISSGILNMQTAQREIEKVFLLYKHGDAISAQEIPIKLERDTMQGNFYSLPAFVGGEHNAAGLKWTTHFAGNGQKGKPRIYTLVTISNPEDGTPLAVMEGSVISAMRTGAVSATAFKYLANKNVTDILCCGAGVQARQQIHAACFALPNVKQVYIWNRTKNKADALTKELEDLYPKINFSAADNIDRVINNCDIVIGATAAQEPYLKKEYFKDGCLYCHIGFNEIEMDAVNSFDYIVCDDFYKGAEHSGQSLFRIHREGKLESGKLAGSLSEYISGQRSLTQKKGLKIMFDAFGLPIFDVALASYVYKFAVEHGLGTVLPLWNAPIWGL